MYGSYTALRSFSSGSSSVYPGRESGIRRDEQGRIVFKNGVEWAYNDAIHCATCYARGQEEQYHFSSQGLVAARLPGLALRYEYGFTPAGAQPARKYRNGRIAAHYHWDNAGRLEHCLDADDDLEFFFEYDRAGKLHRVHLQSSGFSGNGSGFAMSCAVTCDVNGTPTSLMAENGPRRGQAVWFGKDNARSSGGMERIHLPVGLGGGLVDADTGVARIEGGDYFPSLRVFMFRGRNGIEQAPADHLKGGAYKDAMGTPFLNNHEFREEDHPRADNGRFITKGGGSGEGGKSVSRTVPDEKWQPEKLKEKQGREDTKRMAHILLAEKSQLKKPLTISLVSAPSQGKAPGQSASTSLSGSTHHDDTALKEKESQEAIKNRLMRETIGIDAHTKLTPSDVAKIRRRLHRDFFVGSKGYDTEIKLAEREKYTSSVTKHFIKCKGFETEEEWAKFSARPIRPEITWEELRAAPYYTERLGQWYRYYQVDPSVPDSEREWTPLRAQMMGERLLLVEHLEEILKNTQFTTEEKLKYYATHQDQAESDAFKAFMDPNHLIAFLLSQISTWYLPVPGSNKFLFGQGVKATTKEKLDEWDESNRNILEDNVSKY